MADTDSITLSQDDINLVLKTVRKENAAHDKADALLGIGLSQSDLDKLFNGKPEFIAQEKPAPLSPEDKRAAKIAERKARAAALLAKVNAESPKRLYAIYGTVLLPGAQVSKLAPGSTLELDRSPETAADIMLDDKVIARGFLETKDGHCSVRITETLRI